MKKSNGVLCILVACSLAAGQTKKVGWSTGYLAGWAQGAYPPSAVQWKAYTHMCHFSAVPKADGSCNLGMGLNASMAQALVTEAHKNGVKAILCVGGAGTGSAFKGASKPASRAAFIANMIKLMTQYGYDGLDVDWEEGTGGADYIALHQELRAELDKITPRPLMTAAVADYYSADLGKVAQHLDQLNNMCYWNKANNLAGQFDAFPKMGIAKTKLGVGIGLDYEEGGNPEVDCDPEAAKAKCEYALANGYGGVMVWEIEMDRKKFGDSQPVHAAIAAFVDKSVGIIRRARPGDARLTALADGAAARLGLRDVRGVRLAQGARPPAGIFFLPER